MRVVGIDCGLSGFVSLVEDDKYVGSFRMPTTKIGKKRNIDGRQFLDCLTLFNPDICLVERQFAKYGQQGGGTTMFGYGYICGLLTAMNKSFETIDAQKWQKKVFGANKKNQDTKELSIASVLLWDKRIDLRKSERATTASADKADSINIARSHFFGEVK